MVRFGARKRLHATLVGSIAAFAVVGLSGCTLGAGSDESAGENRQEQGGRTMKLDLAAAGTDQLEVSVPSEPIATAPASTAGMAFELYSLKRSGKVVNVVFAMHNTGDEEVNARIATRDLDEDPDVLASNASNVSLVDTKGLKEYRSFVTDETDGTRRNCLCSMTFDNSAVDNFGPDERQYFVVQVAAPPESVERVTVLAHVASLPDQKIEG